jgi:sugar lactone lactonase YvrE
MDIRQYKSMKMMHTHMEQVGSVMSLLGEGPVWDDIRQSLLWVDIPSGVIHEVHPQTAVHRQIRTGEMVGAVALTPQGDMIAALQHGFCMIDRLTGTIKRICDPEAHLPGNRFNDGKCDPSGRFWAGTMSMSEDRTDGNLYRIGHDLQPTVHLSQVTVSNGLAWSNDGRYMYHIDSPTRAVTRYDYHSASGLISGSRTVITFSEEDGYPDGMTIDDEGMLWIAHWDGWQLSRWDPASGACIGRISLPVSRVTSCTFGGEGFEDLYVTSARFGLTDRQLQEQPLAGALFVIRGTGCRGMAAARFGI